MNTLLINTAAPKAWVVVMRGDTIVVERSWVADKALGQQLLLAIEEVVAEADMILADIDQIGVHRGPGHYSALRTGILTASLLAQTLPTSLSYFATDSPRQALLEMSPVPDGKAVIPQYS